MFLQKKVDRQAFLVITGVPLLVASFFLYTSAIRTSCKIVPDEFEHLPLGCAQKWAAYTTVRRSSVGR